VLAPLAIVGLFSIRWDRRRVLLVLFLGIYSVSIVLFFVCSRYRVPILPFLFLFAAAGLAALAGDIRERKRRAALRAAALVALFVLLGRDFGALGRVDWAQGYLDEGVAHLTRREWASAAECFREAVLCRPGSRDAEYGLGIALRELGDLEGALVSARRAVALEPRDADVRNNLALTLAAMGRLDEAEAAYRTALEIDPRPARLHANLAQLLQRIERWGEAAEEYRAAIRAGAEDWRLRANLATCLIRSGRLEEGEAELRSASSAFPNDAGPVLVLADHLAGTGRRAEAAALLAEVAARAPGDTAVARALRGLEAAAEP
jgi:Flp pilus assembly protein TadD